MRSLSTILLIAGLIGLLVLLGGLQYRWQSQISENEGEKMHRQIDENAKHFAMDFNREIQNAYFNFQTDADSFKNKDWSEFNERYDFWRSKTTYPELIKDFYFFEVKTDAAPLRYNRDLHAFEPVAWTPELRDLRARFAGDDKKFKPIYADIFTLVLPIHEAGHKIERVLMRTNIPVEKRAVIAGETLPIVKMPERFGYLAIKLDQNALLEQLLPELLRKHFPDDEINLAVTDSSNTRLFARRDVSEKPDATAGLFDLSPDNFIFYANKDLMSKIEGERREDVIVNHKVESRTFSHVETTNGKAGTVKVEVQTGGKPRTQIFTARTDSAVSPWTLSVQHSDGSIDAFVANTKFRNLGVSFGILALLGLAVAAIIFSAQRAKMLAQRKVDFVSSVSHEFRTPLAVIYSAGENLADGVAKENAQVSRYGDLIKGEGRKLSSMVEQILEFAGASSGRRKYNFSETEIAGVVENALAECRPLIQEKNMSVKTKIAASLPPVNGDRAALSLAVQNLIANSVKYSNGDRWLRITAENGDGKVKISVEDHGLGISKSDLRQIFEPFYRAESVVDAQIHGNGLGLSLVKQIAEAHGGKVTAESEVGKGSKFTIELPV